MRSMKTMIDGSNDTCASVGSEYNFLISNNKKPHMSIMTSNALFFIVNMKTLFRA